MGGLWEGSRCLPLLLTSATGEAVSAIPYVVPVGFLQVALGSHLSLFFSEPACSHNNILLLRFVGEVGPPEAGRTQVLKVEGGKFILPSPTGLGCAAGSMAGAAAGLELSGLPCLVCHHIPWFP